MWPLKKKQALYYHLCVPQIALNVVKIDIYNKSSAIDILCFILSILNHSRNLNTILKIESHSYVY
uniref:Uncharacterized protein n=1 Tax=Lepeophtheirus salmonis TaxID=72036 RepID=A0A0K2V5L5_LEPSM